MLIGKASQKFNGQIKFEHSSFPAYIEALKGWLGKKKIFRYQGELHSGWDRNILSGVFSARLYLKRANDQTMRVLRDRVEQLSAISCAHGGRFRGERLDLAWREVLRNHPHDDICGCSVDDTHDDMEVRFKHAQQVSAMLEEDVRMELRTQMDLSHDDRDAVPILLHNPLSKAWSGSLTIDLAVPKFRCWLDHGLPVKILMAAPSGDCMIQTSGLQITPKSWDLHVHDDRVANVELPRIIGRIHVHRLPPGLSVAHILPGRGTTNLPGEPVNIGGEFGRTAYCQGKLTKENYGRDHHPRNFCMWMAGGGIKAGMSHGATDDFSYNVTENPVHLNELNATILHCMGIDNHRFSFPFQGLQQRLTGVEDAHPVKQILA